MDLLPCLTYNDCVKKSKLKSKQKFLQVGKIIVGFVIFEVLNVQFRDTSTSRSITVLISTSGIVSFEECR